MDSRVSDSRFHLDNKQFIDQAVRRFEIDVPNTATVDVTVASTGESVFSLASVATGFKTSYGTKGIVSVEYPIVTGNNTPTYIHNWYIYDNDGTLQLRFRATLTQDFRLRYRVPYTVTESASTVPEIYETHVAILAASMKASAISQRYSETRSETELANVIDFSQRANSMRQRAKELLDEYKAFVSDSIGIIQPDTSATHRTFPSLTR